MNSLTTEAPQNSGAATHREVEAGQPRQDGLPGSGAVETIETLMKRRGIEPWMLAETFEEQLKHVHAHGGWLLAFEKLTEALPELQEKADYNALWDHKVHQVGRYSDGRIYSDEMEPALKVLETLKDFAAGCVAREALTRLRKQRWKRQWLRELKAKAVTA